MMNCKQLIVMWAAIVVLVGMCLFPPWLYHYVDPVGMGIIDRGPYEFVLSPPKPPSMWHTELDLTRLILPVGVVVIIAGGLMITFRDRKRPPA